jgi:hypothetical protein
MSEARIQRAERGDLVRITDIYNYIRPEYSGDVRR